MTDIAAEDHGNAEWLVGCPDKAAQAACLWIGSAGLLILGLQPILLGALLSEGRVNFDELALTATAEILTIGVGSVLAAFAINTKRLRTKAALLLVLCAVLNALTATAQSPEAIILYRGVCGLFEGGLVAFAVELIARSRRAGRFGGYFVTMQTVAQSILAAFLAIAVVDSHGSAGGFMTLAAISLLSVAATYLMPTEYGRMPKPPNADNSGLLRPRPIISLLCIFFFFMFLGALWAFLEPLAGESGITAATAALMVSVCLAAQVAGAGSATLLEERLPHLPVLILYGIIAAGIAAAIALHPGPILFWTLAMATGFIWLFITPFQIRLTIDADDTRSAALLVPAAQLAGAALGPAFASAFIVGPSVAPVAWFACASAVVSAILATAFLKSSGATTTPLERPGE